MKTMPRLPRLLPLLAAALLIAAVPVATQDAPLFEIGRAGGDGVVPALVSLATARSVVMPCMRQAYPPRPRTGPTFIRGQTTRWAGRRVHTFQILFGLASVPASGRGGVGARPARHAQRGAPANRDGDQRRRRRRRAVAGRGRRRVGQRAPRSHQAPHRPRAHTCGQVHGGDQPPVHHQPQGQLVPLRTPGVDDARGASGARGRRHAAHRSSGLSCGRGA